MPPRVRPISLTFFSSPSSCGARHFHLSFTRNRSQGPVGKKPSKYNIRNRQAKPKDQFQWSTINKSPNGSSASRLPIPSQAFQINAEQNSLIDRFRINPSDIETKREANEDDLASLTKWNQEHGTPEAICNIPPPAPLHFSSSSSGD